jgi:hypothetical protein
MRFRKTLIITVKGNFDGDPELVKGLCDQLASEIENIEITVYSRHNELSYDIDSVIVEEERETKQTRHK